MLNFLRSFFTQVRIIMFVMTYLQVQVVFEFPPIYMFYLNALCHRVRTMPFTQKGNIVLVLAKVISSV